MANWKVLKDGEVINTIVADKAFAMIYAEMNGYTVEEMPESEPETPATELTVWDELDAAYQEGVNTAYDQ